MSLQSASSAPSALPTTCPASPPPRLLWPSCPPRLGPPLPSGHYSPSVAPQRAGLPSGTTGWYVNRHASSCGVSHGEAYSDHRHAYKMYFRMTLKGCRRSHNALFLIWANVGTQECTQIGKNDLSASFWVIYVHYCAASDCRMRFFVTHRLQSALFRRVRFSSPGQTSSLLTERRTLPRRPHAKAHSATRLMDEASTPRSQVIQAAFRVTDSRDSVPLAPPLPLEEDRLSLSCT